MKSNKVTKFALILFALGAAGLPPSPGRAAPIPEPIAITDSISKGRIEYAPPEKHHFNTEAPNRAWLIREGAPETRSPLKLRITEKKTEINLNDPAQPAGAAQVKADLYLCDDAKTFCVKKTVTQPVTLPARMPARPARGKSDRPQTSTLETPALQKGIEKETGFIMNDPELALKKARETGRPLLIDFFGIWCPPCNHLDAMVFRTPEFKRLIRDQFVALKLDSDGAAATALKAKYSIRGLPTLVFTTPSGDEISRVSGFRPLDEMTHVAESALASRNEGFEALVQAANRGDVAAAGRAAQISLDRGDAKGAEALLVKVRSADGKMPSNLVALALAARVAATQDGNDPATQEAALRAAIAGIPDAAQTWDYVDSLAQLLTEAGRKDEAKAVLKQGISALEELKERLRSKGALALRGVDLTPADIEQIVADFEERTDQKEKARESYLRCAQLQLKRGEAERLPFPRGPRLEQAYCLKKAGETAKAEVIYREGVKQFPKEYTYHAALASLLADQPAGSASKLNEALKEIRSAMQWAYGGQRIKGVLIEARLLERNGDIQAAIEALDRELGLIPEDDAISGRKSARARLLKRKSELAPRVSSVEGQEGWIRPESGRPIRGIAMLVHGLNLKPEKMNSLGKVLADTGYLTWRVALTGHGEGTENEERWKKVTREQWLADIARGAQVVTREATARRVPVIVAGYSLGALMPLDYITHFPESGLKPDKMILFAPAISINPMGHVISSLRFLGKSIRIPSMALPEYRAVAGGTTLAAYGALVDSLNQLESAFQSGAANWMASVPTLIVMDPEDELVRFKGIRSLIDSRHLAQWKILEITNVASEIRNINHHFIIDERALGNTVWKSLSRKITEYLSQSQDGSSPTAITRAEICGENGIWRTALRSDCRSDSWPGCNRAELACRPVRR